MKRSRTNDNNSTSGGGGGGGGSAATLEEDNTPQHRIYHKINDVHKTSLFSISFYHQNATYTFSSSSSSSSSSSIVMSFSS